VSRAESIREFALVTETFTIEGGELTPTLKVRRAFVETKYRSLIDALYNGRRPTDK
jgi:long-chain acyl-CoA synthetase